MGLSQFEKKLCLECGREFIGADDFKYDKISGKWIDVPKEVCNDCKADLGISDDEEIETGAEDDEDIF